MALLLGCYIVARDRALRGQPAATWHGWSREALSGWPTYLRCARGSACFVQHKRSNMTWAGDARCLQPSHGGHAGTCTPACLPLSRPLHKLVLLSPGLQVCAAIRDHAVLRVVDL